MGRDVFILTKILLSGKSTIRSHSRRVNPNNLIEKLCPSIVRYALASWRDFNPLSANPTKWSNTTKQSLGVFDHFVGLALKGLKSNLGLRIVKWNSTILKFL